ncbi:MAG: hypothetical protein ACLFRT_02705 [Actinomycetota bacterium]
MILPIVVVATACSSGAATTTTTPPTDIACEKPPADELENPSAIEISVEPNPAPSRETISLTVSSEGLPDDALAGVDARWQCWDGSQWVTTHAVYRGFGDNPGQTIPINSAFQIRVPSIGLELDRGFPIVIPQVEQGTYRIEDEVIVDDESLTGHVIVEVLS